MAIRDTVNNYYAGLSEGPFLIIGFGNIGEKYDGTRHNVGFMALDKFAKHYELGGFTKKTSLNSDVIETNLAGEKVILAKPSTYMNKSGLAVVQLQNYFMVNDPRILVVHDDVDIEFGTIRNRIGGGSAGHNGIKSIEQVIGDEFARIRVGIKNEHLEHNDTSDFVLNAFSRAELGELDNLLAVASEDIMSFIQQNFEVTSKTP